MKRLFFFVLLAVFFVGCYKYPDTSQLSTNFVVVTNYDNTADFTSYKTFVLPPYVGLISSTSNDSTLDPQYGDQILNTIATNLTNRGYTEVNNNHTADLGIVATAFKDVTIISGWYPGGWWGYPGWGGCYWYYCGYYPIYPPYYPTYVYETGSVVVELVDLKHVPAGEAKLDVVWTNWNGGALGSNSTNLQLALNAINQGFTQSPYIKAQ